MFLTCPSVCACVRAYRGVPAEAFSPTHSSAHAGCAGGERLHAVASSGDYAEHVLLYMLIVRD